MASFSITGNNVKRCSGFCSYCVAGSTSNYVMGCKKDVEALEKIDEWVWEKEYKADWNKVEESLANDPQIKEDKAKNNKSFHCDLWGADSATNLLMIDDMVKHLTDIAHHLGYEYISFSDSTNGIGLLRDEVADYHREHNIHIQLSHDGLGQFIRTRDIEPLEFDNTKALIKEGVLNAINCTLSFYNYDIISNFNFWTKYIKNEIWPDIYDKNKMATEKDTKLYKQLYIKLNHIYNGTPYNKERNTFGLFNGRVYEQLKGEEFGDFNFINDRERADKYGIEEMAHVLDEYIHSYRMMLRYLGTIEAIPFYSYFSGQINRFKLNKDTEAITGSCRAYQRWKHNIGEERSKKSTTFVIDTLGNYSECNLIDSNHSVKNPGGVQPAYCEKCKYRTMSECMPCGSECFPNECHYNYVWANFLEELKLGIYKIPNRFGENK